ncbi:MAG: tetratricopeptide repeat protein, partial [Limisphaerales bacterium]
MDNGQTVLTEVAELNIAAGQPPLACRAEYEAGLAALERHEAETAVRSLLKACEEAPGFIPCRQALRRAAITAAQDRRGAVKKLLQKWRALLWLHKAEIWVRLRPLKALSFAERALLEDPFNVIAHKLVARAALAANLPQIAVLSLNTVAHLRPFNHATALEYAEASAKCGDASTAAAVYGRLLKENPGDHSVARALKRLSAHPVPVASLPSEDPNGNADVPMPRPRETSGLSEDDALIKRYEMLVIHCPNNTKVLTTLGDAYVRKGRFDTALVCYQRALKQAGPNAPALQKTIVETNLKKFDTALAQIRATEPDCAAKR